MRAAAIDCGTNSLRLLIADVEDGQVRDVVRTMRVVRLGEGVDVTGRLAPEALERAWAGVQDYADQIKAAGVQAVRMVATSASRDAENADEFVAGVVARLGQPPEVISGAEEAHLSFVGARCVLDIPGTVAVVDIGGGSTEFVVGSEDVDAALSVDVGCVRMTERHLRSDPPAATEIAAATHDIDAGIARAQDATHFAGAAAVLHKPLAHEAPLMKPGAPVLQLLPVSTRQVDEQPSLLRVLPSSQPSLASRAPLPQVFAASHRPGTMLPRVSHTPEAHEPLPVAPGVAVLHVPPFSMKQVDAFRRLQFGELAEILRDENRSVLFSSHTTQDVEQLSDSITFLHKGKTLASQDKETYIEGWRRVMCTGNLADDFKLENVAGIKSNGSIHELKVKNYNDSILTSLADKGLSVTQVDRMSLEQIFIASVREIQAYESRN